METTYKYAFYALLIALSLAWVVSMEYRLRQSPSQQTASDNWLFQSTNLTSPDGNPLTRAMLLDQLIASGLQQAASGQEAIGDAP
tara:strand:- start:360 stop:614 length:255 start_codon:yes stop_codon:yes gene_type:complete